MANDGLLPNLCHQFSLWENRVPLESFKGALWHWQAFKWPLCGGTAGLEGVMIGVATIVSGCCRWHRGRLDRCGGGGGGDGEDDAGDGGGEGHNGREDGGGGSVDVMVGEVVAMEVVEVWLGWWWLWWWLWWWPWLCWWRWRAVEVCNMLRR